jgi:hypothetical protein
MHCTDCSYKDHACLVIGLRVDRQRLGYMQAAVAARPKTESSVAIYAPCVHDDPAGRSTGRPTLGLLSPAGQFRVRSIEQISGSKII